MGSKQNDTTHPPLRTLEYGLPDVNRFITATDSNGKAIISTALPEAAEWTSIGPQAKFFLGYTTRQFPASLDRSPSASHLTPDLQSYKKDMSSAPGLSISTGTVLRYVDVPPNSTSAMHVTRSLDYGIVLEGEMELILENVEDGEVRLMRRGDSCIQRGTRHAWRNVTPVDQNGGWGRMVYVLIGAEGDGLVEDLADMQGVPKSD